MKGSWIISPKFTDHCFGITIDELNIITAAILLWWLVIIQMYVTDKYQLRAELSRVIHFLHGQEKLNMLLIQSILFRVMRKLNKFIEAFSWSNSNDFPRKISYFIVHRHPYLLNVSTHLVFNRVHMTNCVSVSLNKMWHKMRAGPCNLPNTVEASHRIEKQNGHNYNGQRGWIVWMLYPGMEINCSCRVFYN